ANMLAHSSNIEDGQLWIQLVERLTACRNHQRLLLRGPNYQRREAAVGLLQRKERERHRLLREPSVFCVANDSDPFNGNGIAAGQGESFAESVLARPGSAGQRLVNNRNAKGAFVISLQKIPAVNQAHAEGLKVPRADRRSAAA